MKKRNAIRIFSFSICIVAVLTTYAIIGNNQSKIYKARLEASYQQSLTELSECLDSIETNLTKSAYASTPTMMTILSEDLYSECNSAKNALSHLPIDQMNLSGEFKFLSQAGDYAKYLSAKIKDGQEISQEEYENLQMLLNYSREYSKHVSDMVTKCSLGGRITENEVKNKNNDSKISNLSLNFDEAEKAFSDFPTLLYDGPFADAVLNREPVMVSNAKSITKEEGKKIAAMALNVSEGEITFQCEEFGSIPCYDFAYDDYTIAVTKNGGYVAYIISSKSVKARNITEENAINIAKSYLKNLGYDDMQETYYSISNNICVINFAYSEDNVIRYTDLIKVGISMADGKIFSLEAKGYLTNHRNRDEFEDGITEEEAKSKLSSNVEVISSRMCLIPKSNGKESYCYQFHCKSNSSEEEILVYINAITGEEEDILLLLYSDNGTLTK